MATGTATAYLLGVPAESDGVHAALAAAEERGAFGQRDGRNAAARVKLDGRIKGGGGEVRV